MMSPLLYNVCLPLWCLSTCVASAYLYDVYLPVWCLLNVYVCSTLWCLYLNDVSSSEWCLLYCMMSAYLYDVSSSVWCLPSCMILLTSITSAQLSRRNFLYFFVKIDWAYRVLLKFRLFSVLWKLGKSQINRPFSIFHVCKFCFLINPFPHSVII
jgi:hypothetical protein